MINVIIANEQATKLEITAQKINGIINDYNRALSEIDLNNSSSSKKISKAITDNITKLKIYQQQILDISKTIKSKAQEIRAQQEKEFEEQKEKEKTE